MPTAFIGTGSPTTLTMNGACPVDGPSIGLFAFVTVVPASSGTSYTASTRTLTYGPSNIAATSFGAIDAPGTANGWIELFYLQGITFGAGASSKVVFTNSAAVKSIGIETITYTNVSQVTPGSFTTNSHTGTSCSLSLASVVGKYVVGGFACAAAVTGASAGTQRLVANSGTSGNAQNASVVDTAGAAVSTLTATTASSAVWAGVACGIDFIVAANADHQSLTDNVHNGLTGDTRSAVSQASVQTAVANHFENLLGTSTTVEALAQPAAKTGLVGVAVDFSAYENSGSLPSVFTGVINFGAGTGQYGIVNGKAAWVPDLSGATNSEAILYNAAQTATDYQIVSIIPTSSPVAGQSIFIQGRIATLGVNNANLILASSTDGAFDNCQLQGSSTFTLKYIAGATYSFVLGIQGLGVHYYQALINGVPQVVNPAGVGAARFYIQDSTSLVGSSNRKTGFTASTASFFGPSPLPISWFGMQDQNWPPGPPDTEFVATSESTSSTSYADLATTTDQVTVNIGSSGLAEVFIYGALGSAAAVMSFAIAGATTQAASDAYAISAGAAIQAGAMFLIPGLNPGSTTFKLKYKSAGGSVAFLNRRIAVSPR